MKKAFEERYQSGKNSTSHSRSAIPIITNKLYRVVLHSFAILDFPFSHGWASCGIGCDIGWGPIASTIKSKIMARENGEDPVRRALYLGLQLAQNIKTPFKVRGP